MTKNLRLLAVATASIIALSDLEMAHAGRARPNNNKKRDKDRKAAATDTAKRNQNSQEAAALAASSILKDEASSVVPGASTLKPIDSNSNAEEEEKLEKIGEDIALLKLDDKVYWNRFLQNSGSAGAAPSAAPTEGPTLVPLTTVPTVPTNPVPTNPVPTNPVPTNPLPTNPVSTSSFSFTRRTRRQRRVKKRNDSDA